MHDATGLMRRNVLTRRGAMKLGLAGLAAAGGVTILPLAARAGDADVYETPSGKITIYPIQHASFVMTVPAENGEMVIYNDPVGGPPLYAGHPAPDLVLITHEHPDHYDPKTLAGLMAEGTKLLTNPAVFDKLPEDLKARATSIGNGETMRIGGIPIAAIPAYNTTPDRLKFHPKGRDNGYILGIDSRNVYIAGDTEDIPEMRALTGIDIAFLPMNLPYTMDIDQAASAVAEFKPAFVYPYHYKGSDIDAFAAKVAASGVPTKVVRGPWYG